MNISVRKLAWIQHASQRHWVGDGYPVRRVFSYGEPVGRALSPFLLLDFAGPMEFPPTVQRLGIGEHPHRGFETVTIVYQGEVEHRDSSGGGGRIGAGDVQWMTAASGVVHQEFHGTQFARLGGTLEMVQLWVNLPSKHKMSAPRYQAITSDRIPSVNLPRGAGVVRVIAGEYESAQGPADTFSRLNVLDVRLRAGSRAVFQVQDHDTAAFVVLSGVARVTNHEDVTEAGMAVFDSRGTWFEVEAVKDTTLLTLAGEPIDEPIVGQGPFVMNTQEEVLQASYDYQNGKMGHIVANST